MKNIFWGYRHFKEVTTNEKEPGIIAFITDKKVDKSKLYYQKFHFRSEKLGVKQAN